MMMWSTTRTPTTSPASAIRRVIECGAPIKRHQTRAQRPWVQSPEATPWCERSGLINLSIAGADVGSEANGNFGWAVCDVPGAVEEVPLREEADYDVVSRAQAV